MVYHKILVESLQRSNSHTGQLSEFLFYFCGTSIKIVNCFITKHYYNSIH